MEVRGRSHITATSARERAPAGHCIGTWISKTISRFFSPQQKPNIALTPVFEWNLETQAKMKI
jgi:hypothetical protein